MIDTANKTTREVQTPDGKGTLIQIITDTKDRPVAAFVKIAGVRFLKKYKLEQLEEVKDGQITTL